MTEVSLEGTQELMRLPRHGRHPGHRRHRPGARRLFVRQARLRRRARATCPPTSRRRPTCPRPCGDVIERQDLRQRDAVLVRAVARLRRGHQGPGDRRGEEERRLLPERGGGGRGRAGGGDAAAAGQPARSWASRPPYIAEKAGHQGAAGDARAGGAAGRRRPRLSRSRSRSCRPVLAFYVVKDWHEGCERVLQLLRYGGTGHTMAIHSKDDAVIREFALKKPVFRIVANTQSSMGATGYTTGLAPSMSLGCGAYAGNITSDNITPLHLINVKRLAYELPRDRTAGHAATASATRWRRSSSSSSAARRPPPPPPAAPRRPPSHRLPPAPPRPRHRRSTSSPRTTSGGRSGKAGRSGSAGGRSSRPAARDCADGQERPGRSATERAASQRRDLGARDRTSSCAKIRRGVRSSAPWPYAGGVADVECRSWIVFVGLGTLAAGCAHGGRRPPRSGRPRRSTSAEDPTAALIASADAHLAGGHRPEQGRATSTAPARSSTAPLDVYLSAPGGAYGERRSSPRPTGARWRRSSSTSSRRWPPATGSPRRCPSRPPSTRSADLPRARQPGQRGDAPHRRGGALREEDNDLADRRSTTPSWRASTSTRARCATGSRRRSPAADATCPASAQVFAAEGDPAGPGLRGARRERLQDRARSRARRPRACGSSSPRPASATAWSRTGGWTSAAIPEKSTRAAAHYLKELYDEFGDWNLALAALQRRRGPRRARPRPLRRRGLLVAARDARTCARETKNYVPMIHAAIVVAKAPEKYGFDVAPEPLLTFDTVPVEGAVDLRADRGVRGHRRCDDIQAAEPGAAAAGHAGRPHLRGEGAHRLGRHDRRLPGRHARRAARLLPHPHRRARGRRWPPSPSVTAARRRRSRTRTASSPARRSRGAPS